MDIREATDNDIPSIVNLLKLSLGEGLMPKSEAYWRWKHIQNPFGRSPVLLAFDNDRLVGVRAFMQWTWQMDDRRIKAVRAVDTATHPEFQGRGIFSKLTKALLQHCEEQGASLVFNTPNDKSMPGYLKMGWVEAGRLPVRARIAAPVRVAFKLISRTKSVEGNYYGSADVSLLEHPGLSELLRTHHLLRKAHFITAHSPESLLWRYRDVPVERYFAEGIESGNDLQALIIYRLKQMQYGLELRVTDYFAEDRSMDRKAAVKISELAKLHNADVCTAEGLSSATILDSMTVKRQGPIVTVRKIAGDDFESFIRFKKWLPSVGDLELF